MGIISGNNAGKEIFSGKWTTAEITDNGDEKHFVPIKYVLGDYFLTEIRHSYYCFRLGKVKTTRMTLTKSFKTIDYDTENYMPLDGGNIKALEDLLNKNDLPKVTTKMESVLKHFSNKEKKQGDKEHSITNLITEINQAQGQIEQDKLDEIVNYLRNLETEKIIGPVRKVSEFLDSDFQATDAKFLGTVMSTKLILEQEHKKITNTTITSKKPWLKIILIAAVLGLIIGAIALLTGGGNGLSNIIPSFPSPGATGSSGGGQSYNDADLEKQYPSPESMKEAIAQGHLDYTKLSPFIKKMVDQAKLPVATPTPLAH